MKLALIMLAAGNSRRFGSNKLLFPVDGRPMYLHTLEALLEVKRTLAPELKCSVTVVTQYEEIEKKALEAGAQVLINPRPKEGISSSLKIGLHANVEADACLFAVSDQPHLTAKTVEEMIRAYRISQKGMGCLCLDPEGTKTGNPCIFSRKYYRELLALSGDSGGKRVLLRHPGDICFYLVRDSEQLTDVDENHLK